MNRSVLVLIASSALALGLGGSACKSSKSSASDAGSKNDSGTATGGKGATGTGGTSGKGGSGGTSGKGGSGGASGSDAGSKDAGATAPTCAAYCDAIMKNCTGGDGSSGSSGPDATKTHQQYSSRDNCLQACMAFPVGTPADEAGNTLGCRLYHAGAAASDATLHCPHAGPSGDGVCGKACDGYCQLVKKYCVGTAKIYADDAACHARCAATTDDVRFNLGVQDGNHVACLLYHAQEAPLAPADHCTGDLAEEDGGPATGSIACQ